MFTAVPLVPSGSTGHRPLQTWDPLGLNTNAQTTLGEALLPPHFELQRPDQGSFQDKSNHLTA